jgi:tRNA threonylcarbamoyladenosine biosynthesis protein TsaB
VTDPASLAGGNFSAQLVPQIAALLEKHEFRKTDIGGFVVVSGPGSFTGLRVGLAAIKALAEILQKPIVAVPLLEVVALASCTEGRVLAALDAGRGEVYAGEYEIAGGAAQAKREQLLPKEEFLVQARGMLIATPDAVLAAVARDAGLSVIQFESISLEMIARLGWRKLKAGETTSPEQLDANYIRRSDAEIFGKPGV